MRQAQNHRLNKGLFPARDWISPPNPEMRRKDLRFTIFDLRGGWIVEGIRKS
jgi:hypothetical protein